MKMGSANRKLTQLVAIGSSAVSMFLMTGSVSDPVNVTKMFLLGCVSISSGFVLLFPENMQKLIQNKSLISVAILFFVSFTVSLFFAHGPFVQGFYGVAGRNTGFLTYFFLLILLLASSLISSRFATELVFKCFMLTGLVNLAYCAWVLVFGDFIGWNNIYGNILGLFGNSDFISAYLGMFITGLTSLLFSSKISWRFKLLFSVLLILSVFEIYKSKAIQGFLVSAVGFGVISLLWLRSKTKSELPALAYGGSLVIMAAISVLGMLQIGPASFLYKRSVSFRGTYWYIAEKMGLQYPFTGVGPDGYGDWYRRLRPARALVDTPGPNITSNVAHNVVLDFFASGGWPLLAAYLGFILLAVSSAIKVMKRSREFDPVFVAILAIWLGYQAQSIISINQIGLAVWGWVLTGVVIGYPGLFGNSSDDSGEKINRRNARRVQVESQIFSPGLVAGIGMVVGALLAAPPLSADMKWMTAIKSRNATNVEKALTPAYLNPENSMKYAQAVGIFQESKLDDLAHKYALKAVKFNPDFFDAWRQLYTLPKTSDSERNLAVQNMKRLDPLNPDVTQP